MEYKSPVDVLSYVVDWTNEIGGSTISTTVWVLQSGIVKDTDSNTTTTTTVKISSGTAGIVYQVQNKITTAAGETFEKLFFIRVREQLVG